MKKNNVITWVIVILVVIVVAWYVSSAPTMPANTATVATTTDISKVIVAKAPPSTWYKLWQVGETAGAFRIASIVPMAPPNDALGRVTYTGTATVSGTYYQLDGMAAGPHFDVDPADAAKIPHIIPGDTSLSFMLTDNDGSVEQELGTKTSHATIVITDYVENYLSEGANTATLVSVEKQVYR